MRVKITFKLYDLILGLKFCRRGHQSMYHFFYSTDMVISRCTGMQYELVVGINLLLTASDVPVWCVDEEKSFCFLSGPVLLDLVSLALTKPRWTVVLTLWMPHCSADKNGIAMVWESQPFWGRPPTVSTQRCTSSPLFYANSCGSFEEPLCSIDRSF